MQLIFSKGYPVMLLVLVIYRHQDMILTTSCGRIHELMKTYEGGFGLDSDVSAMDLLSEAHNVFRT